VSVPTGVAVLGGAAAAALLTVLAVTVWAAVRYSRGLPPSFRCRVGPPPGRRRSRARWRVRRCRATWVDRVLLVRTGVFRWWLTPIPLGVARGVTVRALGRREAPGLGRRPVSLRFTVDGAGQMEIAVAADDVDELVGPFLTTALSGLPDAPRGR
jgi:hypothetical protein